MPLSSKRTEKVVGYVDSGNSDSNRSVRNYPRDITKSLKDIGIKANIGEMQKTVILNTARILRKVLEV